MGKPKIFFAVPPELFSKAAWRATAAGAAVPVRVKKALKAVGGGSIVAPKEISPMTKVIFSICAVLVFVVAVLFCAQGFGTAFPSASVVETEDENYKRGKAFSAEKKDSEAMEAFYKVVNARDEAPESHLELGLLALRRDMPLDAVYHLRQYLRQRPVPSGIDQKKALVEDQIRAATKMFLSQQPGRPFETASAAPDFEKKYDLLRKENDALKREQLVLRRRIVDLEGRLGNTSGSAPIAGAQVAADTPVSQPVVAPAPDSPGHSDIPATHTVVKGDTLTKISQKYYGTQNRWREIYNYNRDTLSTPSSLKIGDKLKLPPQ